MNLDIDNQIESKLYNNSLGKIHIENFHSTSRSVYCEV
jgi:hypothetical protein